MTEGYFAIIAWDSVKGQDWRRLWESPVYNTETKARNAVAAELATGKYPYRGTQVVIHYRGDK